MGYRPADRESVNFWVDEETYQKALKVAAKNQFKSPAVLAKNILEKYVEHVALSSTDYMEMAERVKANETKKYRKKI